MKRYVVALDQGTTSSRCIVFDKEQQVIGMAQKEYTQLYPQPGWVEHDPMEIYSSQYGVLMETLAQISRTPENIDSIIYEVKQYIDQNYHLSLSLDGLASRVHLSPSYFSKLFKREMGENLSTYIMNTRIERAKLLLRTTDKKAYEIAEAVGIYDPVYFSKIFKKAVGLKPKEYRERPDAEETERMIKS